MLFGKKKTLAVFLEKDSLKLLAYEGKTRIFAGQITFAPEVVHDGFIADPVKFGGQIKIAFAQKVALQEVSDVVLFLPPDKSFTKTLPATESAESFVKTLPYFREELVINEEKQKEKTTYIAFEKKLIEDLQRPFLESGKKVAAVKNGVSLLVSKFAQEGKYFLLVPLEKEIAVVQAEGGELKELAVFKNDVFAIRFKEMLGDRNLAEIHQAFTVGVFPAALLAKIRQETVLTVSPVATEDIYDLQAGLSFGGKMMPKINITINHRYLFLGGAVLIGFLLTARLLSQRLPPTTSSPVQLPSPSAGEPAVPEPKPADFMIEVLNGTEVTGEAGRLAEELKTAGFQISGTKNATSSGFAATRLRAVPDVPEKILADLKTKLSQTYESVSVEKAATLSAQIEIIIGKKK